MIKKAWNHEKIRYLIIGGYNTFFGYGIFVLLWTLFQQYVHYLVLVVISHIISVINAFIGYRIFVFRKSGGMLADFVRFNMVYLGTLLFNLATLPVLVNVMNLHPLLAQAIVIAVTVVTSYVLHRRFSFKLG